MVIKNDGDTAVWDRPVLLTSPVHYTATKGAVHIHVGKCNRHRFQMCFRLKSRSKCPNLCYSRDFLATACANETFLKDMCSTLGMKLGRPKGSGKSKLDKYQPEIEALLANGSTQHYIANRFDTTESNLSRWMKKHKPRRNRGQNKP